jgi:DNA-binding transcriptional ArsR family regulator
MLKTEILAIPTYNDLNQFRLAFSPLIELSISYSMYKNGKFHGLYREWVAEVNNALHDIHYPMLDALVGDGKYIPDFLTPTPVYVETDIEVGFAEIANTPPHLVQEHIQALIDKYGMNEIRHYALVNPQAALEQVIVEMRDYWQRTMAHHWTRLLAVLENDVLYRSRFLAVQGAKSMFESIGHGVIYEPNQLTITYPLVPNKPSVGFSLQERGVQVVPSVFAGNKTYHQYDEHWEQMLIYPARGAGIWYSENIKPLEALELTLGVPKARMLYLLQNPLNTGELAHRMVLTASAVSQQLKNLHQAGLVESFRHGKLVFYRLTERGEKLLALF